MSIKSLQEELYTERDMLGKKAEELIVAERRAEMAEKEAKCLLADKFILTQKLADMDEKIKEAESRAHSMLAVVEAARDVAAVDWCGGISEINNLRSALRAIDGPKSGWD